MAKISFGSQKSGGSAPSDSGTAYKILVRVCGLAAIGAMILPVFQGLNAIDFFTAIGDAFSAGGIAEVFNQLAGGNEGGPALFTGIFLMLAYVLIPLIGLFMLLTGKYSGGPLTFAILFNIAGWLIVHFWGPDMGLESGFFGLAGIGYYAAMGALFAPFIGMFFLDKSI